MSNKQRTLAVPVPGGGYIPIDYQGDTPVTPDAGISALSDETRQAVRLQPRQAFELQQKQKQKQLARTKAQQAVVSAPSASSRPTAPSFTPQQIADYTKRYLTGDQSNAQSDTYKRFYSILVGAISRADVDPAYRRYLIQRTGNLGVTNPPGFDTDPNHFDPYAGISPLGRVAMQQEIARRRAGRRQGLTAKKAEIEQASRDAQERIMLLPPDGADMYGPAGSDLMTAAKTFQYGRELLSRLPNARAEGGIANAEPSLNVVDPVGAEVRARQKPTFTSRLGQGVDGALTPEAIATLPLFEAVGGVKALSGGLTVGMAAMSAPQVYDDLKNKNYGAAMGSLITGGWPAVAHFGPHALEHITPGQAERVASFPYGRPNEPTPAYVDPQTGQAHPARYTANNPKWDTIPNARQRLYDALMKGRGRDPRPVPKGYVRSGGAAPNAAPALSSGAVKTGAASPPPGAPVSVTVRPLTAAEAVAARIPGGSTVAATLPNVAEGLRSPISSSRKATSSAAGDVARGTQSNRAQPLQAASSPPPSQGAVVAPPQVSVVSNPATAALVRPVPAGEQAVPFAPGDRAVHPEQGPVTVVNTSPGGRGRLPGFVGVVADNDPRGRMFIVGSGSLHQEAPPVTRPRQAAQTGPAGQTGPILPANQAGRIVAPVQSIQLPASGQSVIPAPISSTAASPRAMATSVPAVPSVSYTEPAPQGASSSGPGSSYAAPGHTVSGGSSMASSTDSFRRPVSMLSNTELDAQFAALTKAGGPQALAAALKNQPSGGRVSAPILARLRELSSERVTRSARKAAGLIEPIREGDTLLDRNGRRYTALSTDTAGYVTVREHEFGRAARLPLLDIAEITPMEASDDQPKLGTVRSGDESEEREVHQTTGRPDRPNIPTSIEHTEAMIRHQKYESAHVWKIGENGEEYITGRNGETDKVYFPPEEHDLLRDAIFIHNHPNDGAFSFRDVNFITDHDVSDFRAIGPTKRYVYRRPAGGWPKDLAKTWATNADREYYRLKSKGLAEDRAVARARIYAMKRTAEKLNIDYDAD